MKTNNIDFKYNNNLCHCLQTFFINSSNLLAKELLKITNQKQNNCIINFIDSTKYNYIWLTYPSYSESEIKQIIIHSYIIRKHCLQNIMKFDFNYTEDIYVYMQQLIKELESYIHNCTTISQIKIAHKQHYSNMYDIYLKSDMYLKNKETFYDYINPLYKFNFDFEYANPWPCIFENKLKVLFIPNINNILKHAPTE